MTTVPVTGAYIVPGAVTKLAGAGASELPSGLNMAFLIFSTSPIEVPPLCGRTVRPDNVPNVILMPLPRGLTSRYARKWFEIVNLGQLCVLTEYESIVSENAR